MKDSYAVIITYDENGGFWDHVAPPHGPAAGARADFFGPGTRIPTAVVSPSARKGHVDHTELETTSILRLINDATGSIHFRARATGGRKSGKVLEFGQ